MDEITKKFSESHKKLVDDRLQQKKKGVKKGYVIEDKKFDRNKVNNEGNKIHKV